jgi:putative ABC transport system substrate-binding protein
MRRREIIGGIASLTAIGPRAAHAQKPMPLVGYLTLRSSAGNSDLLAAFLKGLSEMGFEENSTVTIGYAVADADEEKLKLLAEDLVARRAAVIFAANSRSALVAKAATSTIPIVYVGASDPVAIGLVQSLARPGGNVTGVTMYSHTFSAKRLELLHQLVPQATKVGVLVNPVNPSATQEKQDLAEAANAFGIQLVFAEARSERDLHKAFADLVGAKATALYMVDDAVFGSFDKSIAARALESSLPAISTLRSFAAAGGLASYGTDFPQIFHDAAFYVARILKGESPSNLPVMLPTKFMLTINQKTARALGLTLPEAVLARAEEVIE